MKISCNILKKHLKNSEKIDFVKIWDTFTIRSAEVEKIEIKGANFNGIVTAKIIECEKHPDSDKLHLLKVDNGSNILDIVCGAPNVRVGLISALAGVGSNIENLTIESRKVAGYLSSGMMCSGKELGISDNHSGIIELDENTPLGVDFKKILPVEDIIVEIDNKSLTHRPDLWGHYGIAREIAAITGNSLLPLELEEIVTNEKQLDIKINNPDLCYRYIGLKIDNINIHQTPMWMQIFLYYVGMRSINLIVDLTNYLMLELSNPMHAFDSRTVKNIEVGLAKDNDKFITLDGNERLLNNQNLMIKNGGEYFAIAGVMGGLDSEIVEDTNSIVLESAIFEPFTVRKTAISLGLRTEASSRYEKSLDPNGAIISTKRFVKLLKEINPDLKYGSSLTDIYPTVLNEGVITLNKNKLLKYLGFEMSDKEVVKILSSLEFQVEINKNDYTVKVPTFRATKDITIEEDLIEEIARIYGYENFETKPLKMNLDFKIPEASYELEQEIKYLLSTKFNLHEVHTYLWYKTSFLKKLGISINNISLLGKVEDNIIRNDLLLSLLEVANTNIANYNTFNIYEIGSVVIDNQNKIKLGIMLVDDYENLKKQYNYAKKLLADLFVITKNKNIGFELANASNYYNSELTQNIIIDNMIIGQLKVFNRNLSNKINKKKIFVAIDIDFEQLINIKPAVKKYQTVSKYPTTSLDYTILTERGTYYKDLEKVLNTFQNSYIISRSLIDIYLDKEVKKVTIRYNVGSMNKTLSANELHEFKESFINFLNKNNYGIIEE